MAIRTYNLSYMDADENVFFARQLEQVKTKTYDVKYPAFKARELIPVDNSIDPGAETVKYEQYDMVGQAKIISSYAKDFPRVDVKAKEFFQVIKSLGDSYGYSLQEIRAARFAGKPLDSRRASTARRAIEQLIDSIAASGDSDNGLTGLLNVANAQSYITPNGGASGSTYWIHSGTDFKTPDEILKDLNGIAKQVVVNTKGVEIPDTLLLPVDQYAHISSTPRSSTSDTTILAYFLANNPYIKQVEPWVKLAGAGANGKDRMVVYRRDPDALQLVIPQEFEQMPPEQEGMSFVINCHARCGGVLCYYPMSIAYGDGI